MLARRTIKSMLLSPALSSRWAVVGTVETAKLTQNAEPRCQNRAIRGGIRGLACLEMTIIGSQDDMPVLLAAP